MDPITSQSEYEKLKSDLRLMKGFRKKSLPREQQNWIEETTVRLKDYRRNQRKDFLGKLAILSVIYGVSFVYFWIAGP